MSRYPKPSGNQQSIGMLLVSPASNCMARLCRRFSAFSTRDFYPALTTSLSIAIYHQISVHVQLVIPSGHHETRSRVQESRSMSCNRLWQTKRSTQHSLSTGFQLGSPNSSATGRGSGFVLRFEHHGDKEEYPTP